MPYLIRYSGVSHIGHRRCENQDNFICDEHILKQGTPFSPVVCGNVKPCSNAVFGVFDGMGGLSCGGAAAQIAAREAAILRLSHDPVESLRNYCTTVNKEVCGYGASNHLTGIGTTAALLVFTSKEICLCNMGDTKIFRISKGKIEQISKDHIAQYPGDRHYLTQYLGLTDKISPSPYLARGRYGWGDQYLICSDGLTDMVPVKDFLQIIRNNNFQYIVPKLLQEALQRGGKDNITIILCKVEYHFFR